jgi:2,5-diketo-D-gluconate reductase A
MKYLNLADGNRIPEMGFGCYNAFGDEMVKAVACAIGSGYAYIDSVEKYGNEDEVGKGISEAGAKREDLFLLSKAWPTSFGNLEDALVQTMKKLGTDYLDAYLLHWPGTKADVRLKAWEQMLRLQERGLVRTAGVSNFLPEQIEEIGREFGALPAIDELECHPSYQQREMQNWCRARKIQTIAYTPINRADDLTDEAVLRLSEKYGKTPAQIVLRWHVQHGQIPIPKSAHAARIRENIDLFDFELTPEEMAAVDAMERGLRRGKDPREFPEGC